MVILEDTNKNDNIIDESKIENNPQMATEGDDNMQIDAQNEFYVARNYPNETSSKHSINQPSKENLQIK